LNRNQPNDGKKRPHGATPYPQADRIAAYDEQGLLSSGYPVRINHVVIKGTLDVAMMSITNTINAEVTKLKKWIAWLIGETDADGNYIPIDERDPENSALVAFDQLSEIVQALNNDPNAFNTIMNVMTDVRITLEQTIVEVKTALEQTIAAAGDDSNAHKTAPVLDHPNGSVTAIKLADNAVTEAKITNNAITEEKITNNAITVNKIANGAITGSKLAAGAITADLITNGSITTDKIAAGAITGAKIATGAITDTNISNLNASKITAGTLPIARGGTGGSTINGTTGAVHNLFPNSIVNETGNKYLAVFKDNWENPGYIQLTPTNLGAAAANHDHEKILGSYSGSGGA